MQLFLARPRDDVTHWVCRHFACCVVDANRTFARINSLHKMSRLSRLETNRDLIRLLDKPG